jgi:hypothetical protein
MKGQSVKDAQYLMKHNRFGASYYKGEVDGDFGPDSAQGANKARWFLGFRKSAVGTNVYGDRLHKYLLGPDRGGYRLTLAMQIRRKARLKAAAASDTVKLRALKIAHSKVGITESPYGSNNNPFGIWYGLNRQPWCAIFVTYCFVLAGDKRTFARGSRSAWAFWPLNMARAGQYGLHTTSNPEPGDIVVYTHGTGHIGIFDKWINRSSGVFQTVEGNTSAGNDANGGAVQIRQRTVGDYMQPHFVRFS